jgi:hypothetical protein
MYYLDDLLVFSNSQEEHLNHLQSVLEHLEKHKLYARLDKCSFGRKEVKFLGQVVGHGRRRLDPDKAMTIRKFPKPTKPAEVRSFYGLVNFCRDFLPGLSQISAPLTDLTKKNVKFNWTPECDTAFEEIKELVACSVELTVFDSKKPVTLQTDASDLGLGVVLLQPNEDGVMVPVSTASRKLNKHEVNYPTHEKELLAIVWALKTLRHYVEGMPISIETDHSALRFIGTQATVSRRMARWIEELQQHDAVIKYKSGKTNVLADLLSRNPACDETNMELKLQVRGPDGMYDFSNYPLYIIDALNGNDDMVPVDWRDLVEKERRNFEWNEETSVLYRLTEEGRRAYLPFEMRADFVHKFHVGRGHMHWTEVVRLAKARVWWPAMRQDIKNWMEECSVCQVHGRLDHVPREEAHVIEESPRDLGRWFMDIIGPLPQSRSGNRYIWTAIEGGAIRIAVAEAMPDFTHQRCAQAMYKNIVARFGVPDEIITDRGRNFMALQLKAYLDLLDTKHKKTSAYHPRTNGRVESLNGKLQRILKKCCGSVVSKWDEYLDEAIFIVNSTRHHATGKVPLELLYGCEVKLPGDTTKPFVLNESDMEDLVEIRARALEVLGQDRAAAIERSGLSAEAAKLRYDELVRSDPLVVDEWVLLRRMQKKKLQSNWIGPYRVSRVGPCGTYELVDPQGNVRPGLVHRDRLKRARVNPGEPPTVLWTDAALEELDPGLGLEGHDMNLLYGRPSDHDWPEQWHVDGSIDAQRRGLCKQRGSERGKWSQNDEEVAWQCRHQHCPIEIKNDSKSEDCAELELVNA